MYAYEIKAFTTEIKLDGYFYAEYGEMDNAQMAQRLRYVNENIAFCSIISVREIEDNKDMNGRFMLVNASTIPPKTNVRMYEHIITYEYKGVKIQKTFYSRKKVLELEIIDSIAQYLHATPEHIRQIAEVCTYESNANPSQYLGFITIDCIE